MKLKLIKALGIVLTASMLTGNVGVTVNAAGVTPYANASQLDDINHTEDSKEDASSAEITDSPDLVSAKPEADTTPKAADPEKSTATPERETATSSPDTVKPSGAPETIQATTIPDKAEPSSFPDSNVTTAEPDEIKPAGSTAPDSSAEPTATPNGTKQPDSSAAPDSSAKPTATPNGTKQPDSSAAPDSSTEPSATPDRTKPPIGSTAPDSSTRPTADPDRTKQPDGSAVPGSSAKPTATPNGTKQPDGSAAPDSSAKPTGSPAPDSSAKPIGSPLPNTGSPAPDGTIAPTLPPEEQDKLPADDGNSEDSGYQLVQENRPDGWNEIDGAFYWYEGGFRQGTEGSGKEIYDPASEAWYWLDSSANGARVQNQDIYVESDGGKWMRYNEDGRKVTGEDYKDGAYYYFEPITGAMVKGPAVLPDGRKVFYDTESGQMVKGNFEVNGIACHFDEIDGHLTEEPEAGTSFWMTIDGASYWYVDWIRQGWKPGDFAYTGEELFDPVSQDWVWLDGTEQGRMAVNKLVYVEAQADKEGNIGKWVFYGSDGHMLKGWTEDGMYYFDPVYGTMAKGKVIIGDKLYEFDPETGMKLSEREIQGFEEYGLECNAEAGVEYDYKTCTYADPSIELMGKAVFHYQILESDESHPAKEGYEWRQVTATITFDGSDAWAMGCSSSILYNMDYYTFKNGAVEKPTDNVVEKTHTVTYMDEEYEVLTRYELVDVGFSEEGNAYTIFQVESQVPVGYDGMVVALYNAAYSKLDSNTLDRLNDDSLIFRMK